MAAFLPDPVLWLTRMYGLVVAYGLPTAIERLAWSLLLALFAYGVLRVIWTGRGSELAVLFGRLLLASALLLALPDVRALTHNTWVGVFEWSSGVWSPGGMGGATSLGERLFEASQTIDLQLGSFIASQAILREGGQGRGVRGTHALALDTSNPLSANIPVMAGVILTLLIPILFAVYAALVFTSGLVVLFGELLLPLSAAMLMLPHGSGMSWMGQWLRMYLGAVFTVAFLPLVFGMIIDLGFAQPTERMATSIEEALAYVQQAATEIEARTQATADAPWWRLDQQAQAWAQETFDAVKVYFDAVGTILLGWLVSLVMIVAGFLIGVFLLFRLERYVTGYLGGLTAGAAGTVGAATLFAAFRGARMLQGPRPASGGTGTHPPSTPRMNPPTALPGPVVRVPGAASYPVPPQAASQPPAVDTHGEGDA